MRLEISEHPLFDNAGIYVPHVRGRCQCGRITRLRHDWLRHRLMCLECLLEYAEAGAYKCRQ